MKMRTFLYIAIITIASAAELRVSPGGSIQDAVDMASPGDTIIVEPGIYENSHVNATYAVHVTTNNIRLIGEVSGNDKVVIRFLPTSNQKVGVYAAPPGCDFTVPADTGACDGSTILSDFSIVGIAVEDFPRNGIQTRRVDKFEIRACESVRNLNNGIYPTVSTNGLVRDNISFGSKDTAMWPTGCDNVTVLNNVLYDSVIGFEITVSNNIEVKNNTIYNNCIGIFLGHPNNTATILRPVMKNWSIEDNDVYDNNRINDAPIDTIQSILPIGIGILVNGVSDHMVVRNRISDNGSAGLVVTGFCSLQELGEPDRPCGDEFPPRADPSADRNLISQNTFKRNGLAPDPKVEDSGIPGVDLMYIQSPSLNETGDDNCFELKIKTIFISIIDGAPSGLLFGQKLPDGCKNDFPFEGSFRRLLNKILTFPKILFRIFF